MGKVVTTHRSAGPAWRPANYMSPDPSWTNRLAASASIKPTKYIRLNSYSKMLSKSSSSADDDGRKQPDIQDAVLPAASCQAANDELEGLTLYEKKCVLINREIDSNGMGRYQWYIWCLCGFGYLLDLLWAQAFGLVLAPLEQEMGFGANESGNISICLEFVPQNRRFLLALLSIFQPIGVVVCCAIAYGFIPNYSCSPNFSEDNPLPSCHGAAAGVQCCTRASNMGWRYLMFTLGGITLGIFMLRFVVFNFQESPKFLVFRGHDEEAIKVLQHIASTNKRACGVSMQDFENLTTDTSSQTSVTQLMGGGKAQRQSSVKEKILIELSRYRLLFKDWEMSRLTTLVWLTYCFDFWGFTLAGSFLPKILAAKNGDLNLSLEFTYRSYIAVYTPGIVGVVLGAMMYRVPSIGRKWTMVISSGLMGASIFIFSAVNSKASNIGLNAMEYFFQSMFNAVLYGWTPEVFPAPIRGTASGLASFWGRLFGIIAPLVAQSFAPPGTTEYPIATIKHILYLAGGVTLGCVLTVAFLPNKAMGRQSM
nr:putative mfs-type transporter pb1e7.08c [Quercus suber]